VHFFLLAVSNSAEPRRKGFSLFLAANIAESANRNIPSAAAHNSPVSYTVNQIASPRIFCFLEAAQRDRNGLTFASDF